VHQVLRSKLRDQMRSMQSHQLQDLQYETKANMIQFCLL